MLNRLTEAVKYWGHVAPIAQYPRNDQEFYKLMSELDQLLDMIGENESHQLMGLVDVLSHLISDYEEQHFHCGEITAKGIDALKLLMESHQLSQSDLPEIGSQGVVSEILSGKRKLNVRQIRLLAKRFSVSTDTFIA